MDLIIAHAVGLLVVAISVAIVARRVHLPYTVGLVVTGVGLAVARIETGIALTHEVIFDVILPPLLFEAALAIHWTELRRDALPILTLAMLGVVISAVVVAAGMVAILGWPMASALVYPSDLFGVRRGNVGNGASLSGSIAVPRTAALRIQAVQGEPPVWRLAAI